LILHISLAARILELAGRDRGYCELRGILRVLNLCWLGSRKVHFHMRGAKRDVRQTRLLFSTLPSISSFDKWQLTNSISNPLLTYRTTTLRQRSLHSSLTMTKLQRIDRRSTHPSPPTLWQHPLALLEQDIVHCAQDKQFVISVSLPKSMTIERLPKEWAQDVLEFALWSLCELDEEVKGCALRKGKECWW